MMHHHYFYFGYFIFLRGAKIANGIVDVLLVLLHPEDIVVDAPKTKIKTLASVYDYFFLFKLRSNFIGVLDGQFPC